MPGDPNELIAQMMAQQGSPGMPMNQGPPAPAPMPPDEAMLAQVQGAMGAEPGTEGGPPPGSGMKWENLQDDQAALQANPTPENVQAFVQYWGQENLPADIQGAADEAPQGGEGEY